MKPNRRISALLLAAVLCFTLVLPAFAADTAANMQLSKTTGTVTVTNASARTLSVKENMRLYNGYTVETAAASYAWINLDNAKLVKLDACSKVEIRKSGKKLEVLLKSGSIYGDVSQPLESDESMNIRTSTAIVGIRGTKFQVGHTAPAGSETGQLPDTLVSVMEGKVSVTTQNTLDSAAAPGAQPAIQTTAVAAGQTAVVAAAPPAVSAGDNSPAAVTVDVTGLKQTDLSGSTQTELTIGGSFTIETPEGQAVTLTPAAAEQQLKEEQAEQLQAAAPSQPPEQTGPGQQDTTTNVWGGQEERPGETPSGGGSSTTTPTVRYTVRFDSRGGSAVASVTVAQGEHPSAPAEPTREGFTFTGWFTDSACTTAYRFTGPLTQDLTLYAGWEETPPVVTKYTVTFDSKGGSAVEAQAGEPGFTPTRPADPARDGYGFEGWFTDSACKTAYDFSTPVDHNLTLYAKWGYSVTLDGGSGDTAEQLDSLYAKGYTKVYLNSGGWTVSGSLTIPAGKSLEIGDNATLEVSGGTTLTNSGTITVNWSLNNDGTIINAGIINNNSTINNRGSINNIMGTINNSFAITNNGSYTGDPISGMISGTNADQMKNGNP